MAGTRAKQSRTRREDQTKNGDGGADAPGHNPPSDAPVDFCLVRIVPNGGVDAYAG